MGESISVWIVLILCGGLSIIGVSSTSRHSTTIYKHAVKSIQSEDGDIIDCVDVHKQPAFDHPLLRNHKIQMSPSHEQAMNSKAVLNNASTKAKPNMMLTSQVWRKNGSCPHGTIPIRRIHTKQLFNYKSSNKQFGQKGPSFPYHSKRPNVAVDSSNAVLVNRSFTILLTFGFNFNAAKADIKVWNPFVERDDEYSSSRIALKNGPYTNYESIEAGWIVNPSVYGDRETRIYVYWTVDGSNMTGCFDLFCPGFIQTSNEVVIGGVVRSIPIPGELPWIMTLYIFKDLATDNWWLQYQDDTYIGYWPAEIFGALSRTAETVQWGGEVYSSRVRHPGHTKTEMGSGELGSWDQRSGWTKRMRVRDNSMVLKYPEWAYGYSDDYDCYSFFLNREYIVDPEFYFGGPGKGWKSWRCK